MAGFNTKSGDVEHRCGCRWTLCLTVVIQTLQGTTAKATLVNVSASGALLKCQVEVPLQSQVRVTFPAMAGVRRGALAQVVRRCTESVAIEWSEFLPQIVPQLLSAQTPTRPRMSVPHS